MEVSYPAGEFYIGGIAADWPNAIPLSGIPYPPEILLYSDNQSLSYATKVEIFSDDEAVGLVPNDSKLSGRTVITGCPIIVTYSARVSPKTGITKHTLHADDSTNAKTEGFNVVWSTLATGKITKSQIMELTAAGVLTPIEMRKVIRSIGKTTGDLECLKLADKLDQHLKTEKKLNDHILAIEHKYA